MLVLNSIKIAEYFTFVETTRTVNVYFRFSLTSMVEFLAGQKKRLMRKWWNILKYDNSLLSLKI